MAIKADPVLKTIREEEFNLVFKSLPQQKFENCLEIGAGSLIQARLLKKCCNNYTGLEYDALRYNYTKEDSENTPLVIGDGHKLPFKDRSFDILFSSCVLEHIPDRNKAMQEFRRVLKADGYMIHILPTPYWKIFQMFFYYVHVIKLSLFQRKELIRQIKDHEANISNKRKSLISKLFPPIHGENFKNNVHELISYRDKKWKKLIRAANFKIIKIIDLIPYIDDKTKENSALVRLIDRLGIVDCKGYICKK